MNVVAVGQKEFRKNISRFSKESRLKNRSYLVTYRNKPIWEVKPCFNEEVSFDDTQIEYYTHLSNTLDFWNNESDDDLFDLNI